MQSYNQLISQCLVVFFFKLMIASHVFPHYVFNEI